MVLYGKFGLQKVGLVGKISVNYELIRLYLYRVDLIDYSWRFRALALEAPNCKFIASNHKRVHYPDVYLLKFLQSCYSRVLLRASPISSLKPFLKSKSIHTGGIKLLKCYFQCHNYKKCATLVVLYVNFFTHWLQCTVIYSYALQFKC